MPDYEHNLYYYPDATGFEKVGELEDPDASYSFNTLLVLRDKHTGALWYASDSGCSCPSPFEDHEIGGFEPITGATWDEFQKAVNDHALPWDENAPDRGAADKTQLLAKVAGILREKGE